MIYHVERDSVDSKDIKHNDIQSIVYLSKTLSSAESQYWSTELEVADLMWVVQKVCHMIDSFIMLATIIHTDHATTTSIVRQIFLSSFNTDKLNLHLIWASQYLFQFNLNIHYKTDRTNTVLNALSRLLQKKESSSRQEESLKEIYVLTATLMKLFKNFKTRVWQDYLTEKKWVWIQIGIRDCQDSTDISDDINFVEKNSLLFFVDQEEEQLCFSKSVEKKMFSMTHDNHQHASYHWVYFWISDLYISKLSTKLKNYIKHCCSCQLNQTKQHALYGQLKLITSPTIPFHTVTMNFIVVMSEVNRYDILLMITDKFLKRVSLISEKITYSVLKWAEKYLTAMTDWKLSQVIIFNQDAKFMSTFWQTTFQHLEVKLLASTTYHPQTDGQSERINQTVKIIIHFLVMKWNVKNWTKLLSVLQSLLNNVVNSFTDRASNEIIYDFKIWEELELIQNEVLPMWVEEDWAIHRKKVVEVLAMVNIKVKRHYDSKHQSLTLQVGQKIFLCLHWSYTLSDITNQKFSNQQTEPLRIIEKIETLTYCLDLSSTWRIHSVIFITQLEPTPDKNDLWKRLILDHSGSVEMESRADQQIYKVKALIRKQTQKTQSKFWTEYLIRWKGWDSEWDQWIRLKNLNEAQKLIQKFESQ